MTKRLGRIFVLALVAVASLSGCGGGSHHGVALEAQHGGRVHAVGFGTPPPGDFGLGVKKLTAVQVLEGYDAVTLGNIPHGPLVVGCYLSGRYANCGLARTDFPNAKLVTIATYAAYSGVAKCVDVEEEDALPTQAPMFVLHELSLGVYRPCVYASDGQTGYEMWRVQAALVAAHIPRGDYTLYLADWDGNPVIPAGFDAKQWFSNCCIDRDSFLLTFLAPAPKPAPPLPICFNRRETKAQCLVAKTEVSNYSRAVVESTDAYDARGCTVLYRRQQWFAGRLRTQPRVRTAYRKGALASTTRAYDHLSCPVFVGRWTYYSHLIAKAEAAN